MKHTHEMSSVNCAPDSLIETFDVLSTNKIPFAIIANSNVGANYVPAVWTTYTFCPMCQGFHALGAACLSLPAVSAPVQTGWQCPVCRSVWSPSVVECRRCNEDGEVRP